MAVSETLRIFVGVKRMPIFLLLIVLGMTGCRQRTIDRTLAEADAVMEHNADSAYALLQQIPDASQSDNDATRAFYALLTNQAAYKLYKPVLPDSLMQAAVNYYRQTNDLPLLCRAIYYRAMPLYEQGRHDQALQLLKEGEQIAAELNDLLQLSKYYESLCMVNDRSRNNDLMLKYATQFLDNAFQLGDSVLIARGYCHVSTALIRMGKLDDSKENIMQSLPYLQSMDNIGRAYILTNVGCTLHEKGDRETARHYLELSLSTHPRPNTYAELGMIYAEEGNDDEAMKCWEKGQQSDNPNIVLYTLNAVFKHYKQRNDLPNALTTLEQIHQLKDSVNRVSEKAKVAEIQLKYDKQVVEKRLYKVLTWTFGGALVVLVLAVCAVGYHRRTVKVFTNRLDESFQTIRKIQQQIDQQEDEKQRQEVKSEKASETYAKKIDTLKKKLADIRCEVYDRIGRGRKVFESVQDNKSIKYRDDENCLIEYYSVFHHSDYHRWLDDYNDLSPRLLTYLVLQNMDKTDADIEQILSINHTSLRSLKSRLNAKSK